MMFRRYNPATQLRSAGATRARLLTVSTTTAAAASLLYTYTLLSYSVRVEYEEVQVPADGNCMFHALAYHLEGQSDEDVRVRVCDWLASPTALKCCPRCSMSLQDFLDVVEYPTWSSYVRTMRRPRWWGDHLALVGAASAYDVNIEILHRTEGSGDGAFHFLPRWLQETQDSRPRLVPSGQVVMPFCSCEEVRSGVPSTRRTIYVVHVPEVHYNAAEKIGSFT
eukprot:PhM_4_TR10736/c0_g1_i1/m.96234